MLFRNSARVRPGVSRPIPVMSIFIAMIFMAAIWPTGSEAQYKPTANCLADASWVTAPNPPEEIPGGGTNFCQFYQFAWQWFLYLGSPVAPGSTTRNFEDPAAFPVYTPDHSQSCSSQDARGIFVRTVKTDDKGSGFITPDDIHQAGGDAATIYDQNGNVVFYEVRFSRDMCTAPLSGNLPAGTTELKFAWRQIDMSEAGQYFTIETTIEGLSNNPVLLGLVGMHLVRTTPLHPEAMWATFEHVDNAPVCNNASAELHNWSFISQEAKACLSSGKSPFDCQTQFKLNQATSEASLTGTPSNICQVYITGTDPADQNALQNFFDIEELNQQLMGPGGFISSLPSSNPMSVWQNYFAVGGIWVTDPSKSSGQPNPNPSLTNQRGSLELTNTVAETTFQGKFQSDGSRSAAFNCFGCHGYTPGKTAVLGDGGTWSHILPHIRK